MTLVELRRATLARLAITADPSVCYVVAVLRRHGPTPERGLCSARVALLLEKEGIAERKLDRFSRPGVLRYIESAANLRRFGIRGKCPCPACELPVAGWVLPGLAALAENKPLKAWPKKERVRKGRRKEID